MGMDFLLQKENMKGGGENAITVSKRGCLRTVYPQEQWPHFAGLFALKIPVINILSRSKRGVSNINPL
ncbi:hypothetical protein D3H65_03925 [Paraflavitalea soli]|uniref:Uncharacterized protein n=1 Tax=Paraflavitalea soli TaxID=2315862 RepID=A0A3B7MIN8_9BACT|nr:hypothetical protein D3H65_03925 [Paraflavitalea soli]